MPTKTMLAAPGPGGGELARFLGGVGARVTVAEAGERLLPLLDADAAALVHSALEDDGVEIRLGASVQAGDLGGYERILVATGRRPNVGGLDALALTISRRGVEVDERLRAAENVWAIGDVTGIAQFTHVGKYQARIAAADMARRRAKADYRAIPAGIFTDPEVGTVGRTEGDELVSARIE